MLYYHYICIYCNSDISHTLWYVVTIHMLDWNMFISLLSTICVYIVSFLLPGGYSGKKWEVPHGQMRLEEWRTTPLLGVDLLNLMFWLFVFLLTVSQEALNIFVDFIYAEVMTSITLKIIFIYLCFWFNFNDPTWDFDEHWHFAYVWLCVI